MEIAKMDVDPSWSIPGDKGFAGEPKSGERGLAFEEVKGKLEAVSDGFVSLDIECLSLLAAANASSPIVNTSEKNSIDGTRTPFKKALSKKGSQRGGERRVGDSAVTTAAGGKDTVLIHVASEGEAPASLPPEKIPFFVAVGAAGRSRRAGRRQGPWLDPRRVVVLFATLSSMGTLILLYFTLSIGKMPGGGHANAS